MDTARLRSGFVACLVLLLGSLSSVLAATPSPRSPVPRNASSSALALTPDGALLLVVNPDSNSLTLVDAAAREVVAEVPVGVDPRTVSVDGAGELAYVANRASSTLSVVDLVSRQVVAEVPVGYRPYGVVVDSEGRRLYVAEQGADRVRVLDAVTLSTLAHLPVADRPSGVALTADGRTLYVTHLLSNKITVVRALERDVYLPLVLQSPTSQPVARDSLRITPTHNLQLVTSDLQLFADSNLVQSLVLSPNGARAYVPHTRSDSSNPTLTFDTTVAPLVSVIDTTEGRHLVGEQFDLGTLDPPGVGLPFDAALAPDGDELWVVNAASNDLTVLDLEKRRLAAHVEVGDNPRAVALSPDGATAYVNNTLAGTLSVVDTATYAVTGVVTTTRIPLPPAVLRGKRLFHSSDDPRLSRAQWISCNTCHFEGEHDGRTWLFGFSGPRNTTSLLGMVETYPLRWSGEWDESADSEFANRRENFGSGLIDGEMNCALSPPDCVNEPPNQGRSYDLDCLAAFIDSLEVPLSPDHARGEPLNAAELRGKQLFDDPALGCLTCHPPPLYTDLRSHDVGTATPDERIGPAYDTPTLRGLYDSGPYFHDGSAATLHESLTRETPGSEHDVRGLLTEEELRDLLAFLEALPFE